MAYSSSLSPAARRSTAVAITLLEGAAIYALVMGLSYVFVPKDPPRNPTGYFPTAPDSPAPTPTEHQRSKHDPLVKSSGDPLVPPTADPGPTASPTSGGVETGGGTGPEVTVSPSPTIEPQPLFKPKSPRAVGRPGEWVSASDYPSQDLREGNQGNVRVLLAVDAAGRVTNCTVTASSGYPRLDAAACTKLGQRARFEPATDDAGMKVAGLWANTVRWQIPRD